MTSDIKIKLIDLLKFALSVEDAEIKEAVIGSVIETLEDIEADES